MVLVKLAPLEMSIKSTLMNFCEGQPFMLGNSEEGKGLTNRSIVEEKQLLNTEMGNRLSTKLKRLS
jgi:hypothetical protein